MAKRLQDAPLDYDVLKLPKVNRWIIVQYAVDRIGAVTNITPVADKSQRLLMWSRRKLAMESLKYDLLVSELEEWRTGKRQRDAAHAANVVAS